MQYGAGNKVSATVTSVKKGEVMSLVEFEVKLPTRMVSVLTTKSLDHLDLAVGDEVQLVVKDIHVLPVKQ